MRAGVVVAALLACCAAQAAAQDENDRLKLSALIQEGDLLLDEAQDLAPAKRELAGESAALEAEASRVRADSDALTQDIRGFNQYMADLNRTVEEHNARCPRQIEDQALVEACNLRAKELQELGAGLDTRRAQLQARQNAINERIESLNANQRGWAPRQREQEAKLSVHERDVKEWLARAGPFLGSNAFKAFARRAGNPPECEAAQRAKWSSMQAGDALRAAHACLKAVQGR